MIHIRIPATSANMGPGFDSIGIAVKLYNHIWVEEIPDGLIVEVKRKQEIEVPKDETNLIYQTMKYFYDQNFSRKNTTKNLYTKKTAIISASPHSIDTAEILLSLFFTFYLLYWRRKI